MLQEKSDSKLDISSNNSFSVNIPKEISQPISLLEKLEFSKKFKKIEEHNLTLVPITMDQEINQFIETFMNYILGKKSNEQSVPSIGLNKYIYLTQHPESAEIGIKVNIFTYNYILSKKFKYLRNEAVSNSDKVFLIFNIYNNKCLENLKQIIEEIKDLNIKRIRKSYYGILLTPTNNILAKMMEKHTINYLQKELIALGIEKFIEINSQEDLENLLIRELIYFR